MPWSKTKTLDSLKHKSDKVKEVFAIAANGALDRGQTEQESIFAGLAAVSNYERKHKKPEVKKVDTSGNHLSLVCHTGNLIDGNSGLTLSTNYQSVTLQSYGDGWDTL